MDECPTCGTDITPKSAPCPLQCGSPNCGAYLKNVKVDINKLCIWLIGGPSCGRSTQCSKIVSKYGFTCLKVPDLLREEIKLKKGTERAKCLSSIMKREELVPNDCVIGLLRNAMEKNQSNANAYLICGFPREERQGIAFDKHIRPVDIIIYLNASDATMIERWGKKPKNPKIKRTPSEQELDLETFKIRLKNFRTQNNSILAQYPHKIESINADRAVEPIFSDICNALDRNLAAINAKINAKVAAEERTNVFATL